MQYALPLDVPAVEIPAAEPEARKTYYSIGEVCSLTSLEPHVLRYWESEFQQLRPKKNRAGNRAYREKDIEIIRYIKHLLYEEKYTIPGAKKKLSSMRESEMRVAFVQHSRRTEPAPAPAAHKPPPAAPVSDDMRAQTIADLKDVLQMLKP
jgi:DNA-binding transcriptional MerR regulator